MLPNTTHPSDAGLDAHTPSTSFSNGQRRLNVRSAGREYALVQNLTTPGTLLFSFLNRLP